MIIFWRPKVDVAESAECLAEHTLYRFGRIELSLTLLTFASRLDLISEPEYCCNEPFVEWYWNDGEPFLGDLLSYHEETNYQWMNHGGEPERIIKEEILCELENSIHADRKAPWTEEQARNHRYILLNMDWQWYKRFFREEKEYMRKIHKMQFFKGKAPYGFSRKEARKLTTKQNQQT